MAKQTITIDENGDEIDENGDLIAATDLNGLEGYVEERQQSIALTIGGTLGTVFVNEGIKMWLNSRRNKRRKA